MKKVRRVYNRIVARVIVGGFGWSAEFLRELSEKLEGMKHKAMGCFWSPVE